MYIIYVKGFRSVKLNVKPLLIGEKSKLEFDYSFPVEYSEAGYSFPEDARVIGCVKDAGGYMMLTATAKVPFNGSCARCLKPVSEVLETEFRRCVTAKLEKEDEDDEYLVATDGSVDIGDPIREELLLSLPLRLLCREDCRGLCPKCGKDLNDGECGCTLHEPDPRWAALKRFSEKK